jgi:hypothetical protein
MVDQAIEKFGLFEPLIRSGRDGLRQIIPGRNDRYSDLMPTLRLSVRHLLERLVRSAASHRRRPRGEFAGSGRNVSNAPITTPNG